MESKIKAVLFDLDGTLADTLEDLADAVNHMLTELGKPVLEVSQIRKLIGKGVRNLTQKALQSDNAVEIDRGMKLLIDFNSKNIAVHSRLYPGTTELLQGLASRQIKMAIVSNKNEDLSRQILVLLDIDHFFTFICGGDTFPELKPSPQPLLHTIKQFGLTAEQVVMVGDSINDISAGNLAGVTTVGCEWGYGSDNELNDATYRTSSCLELASLLQKLT